MSKLKDILVLISGQKLLASQLSSALSESVNLDDCVLCDSTALDECQDGVYNAAFCFVPYNIESAKLHTLRRVLKPGAIVHFHVLDEVDTLRRSCLLSSFVVIEAKDKLLKVKKPEWDTGATSVLPSVKKWTVQLDDNDDANADEVLDDEEFLTEEDRKPPVLEGGKKPVKKACDNCTCGRAEGKEPVKLTQGMLDNPVSSCGSCGLGDPYRCASCPYRGLPSFEPGKKIELPSDFIISDL